MVCSGSQPLANMTDVFSKNQRSEIMRKVKSGKNKSTELKLIKYFRANKIIGWRRNYTLVGKPDFVFLKQRVAIFTDGCYWHGHDCRNLKPGDNKAYWEAKIKRNKERDKTVNHALEEKKWKVIRIWECELTDEGRVGEYLEGLFNNCV